MGLGMILAAACGEDHPAPTVSATVTPQTFVSGSTVTLSVMTTHFDIRNPANGGHQHGLRAAAGDHEDHDHDDHGHVEYPTAGHYHVYLDSTEVNPLVMGYENSIDFLVTATAGPHKLIIRLNEDSHAFLVPEIKTEVSITVQ